jgi:6-phosphogluconolactonase
MKPTIDGPMRSTTGEPEVRIFDDEKATAAAAAEFIATTLRETIDDRGRVDWATTGGSAPAGVYRNLATGPLRESVPWQAVHVWWGDDRYVPRDHPLSNVVPFDGVLLSASGHAGMSGTGGDAAMVKDGYLPGVYIPPANIHAFRTGDAIGRAAGPEWVAERYEEELRAAAMPEGEGGFPSFDVLFLGVGPDGHTLSCFPGSPLLDSTAWVSAVPAPTHVEPHVQRISLNPAFIAAARHTVLVVHGEGKAAIVGSIFGSEQDPRRWPAQLARREGAVWFLDRAAAAQLPR